MRRAVFAAAALALLPVHAAGIDELGAFVKGTRSTRANFQQVTTDRTGRVVQKATGTFAIARPDRFRWTYDKPLDQLIVGDGARVFVYDKDLNQVIVRPMSKALGSTPAALLAGDDALEKSFTLVDGGGGDGLAWVSATPKNSDAGFSSVRIGFRDALPRAMVLVDMFGQTTRLTFDQVERNPALDAATFRFTPPAGADVIGEGR